MKNLFKFLLLLMTLTVLSCSSDTPIVPTKSVPILNVSDANKKPAIINIYSKSTSKTTGKVAVVKKLDKVVFYWYNNINNVKYKINLSQLDYSLLPTDNLYDPTEEQLNVNTKIKKIEYYVYTGDNLTKIITENIEDKLPNDTTYINYDTNGTKLITKYRGYDINIIMD